MITVIGEALIDLVPTSDTRALRVLPGGRPLHVAIGTARLGHPTALMARLSGDHFGQFLREHITGNGVDLDAAAEADEPTTLVLGAPGAATDAASDAASDAAPDGSRPDGSSRFYLQGTADWQWSVAELGRIPASTTVLNFGSLACCLEPGAGRILKAVARQRRRGALVCLDPNVCPDVLGTPARGRLLVERMVMAADVVRASSEDMTWLYPGRALADLAAHWLRLGPGLVVITCGADGAIALRGSGTALHRPARRVRVMDTAGAGEAFTAALLGELHQLRQAGASCRALGTDGLTRILDTCAVAAGLTCERAGVQLPAATELRHAMAAMSAPGAERSHPLPPLQVGACAASTGSALPGTCTHLGGPRPVHGTLMAPPRTFPVR